MEYSVIDNKMQQEFEIRLSGEVARLEYRWYGQDLALMHTFVPDSLEGKGLASALAHYALEYAREKELKILVYCPFVGAYLKKHPGYLVLVDKNHTPG